MNSIRQIQELNRRELEAGVSPEASWHTDYRDTAYIYIGGLPFELSEGDIITIFSQYGEPTFVHLVRDKETGKSKGFAFLKYEDQRSTDLAVDNLGGAVIMGRTLRVDHTRYKKKDEEEALKEQQAAGINALPPPRDESTSPRRLRSPEREPKRRGEISFREEHDDEDPMKDYLARRSRSPEGRKRSDSRDRERRRRHRGDDRQRRHRHDDRDRHHSHRSSKHHDEDGGRGSDTNRSSRPRDDDEGRERHKSSRYRDEEDRTRRHERRRSPTP